MKEEYKMPKDAKKGLRKNVNFDECMKRVDEQYKEGANHKYMGKMYKKEMKENWY